LPTYYKFLPLSDFAFRSPVVVAIIEAKVFIRPKQRYFSSIFLLPAHLPMARWPRNFWTSLITYGVIFVMFPALCLLAYAWVQQWIF